MATVERVVEVAPGATQVEITGLLANFNTDTVRLQADAGIHVDRPAEPVRACAQSFSMAPELPAAASSDGDGLCAFRATASPRASHGGESVGAQHGGRLRSAGAGNAGPEPNVKDWEQRRGLVGWERSLKPNETARFKVDYVIDYPKEGSVLGL